jgi:hypothetical protein
MNSNFFQEQMRYIKKYKWEICVCGSIVLLIILYLLRDKYADTKSNSDYDYLFINPVSDVYGTLGTIEPQIQPPLPKKKRAKNKHESECRRILEKIYNKSFHNTRPSFLEYKTGHYLELDMYNEDLKLALEYDGEFHTKFIPYFHKTYADFVKVIEKDRFKDKRCREMGIKLIRVPHTVKFEKLEEYIRGKL